MGPFKNEVTRVRRDERGYPKLVTKNDIKGGEYKQIVTSPPKKLCTSFYFLFVFR